MVKLRAPMFALIAALTTATFVVPRPHTPKDVPYPPVIHLHTRTERADIAERAQLASAHGLHVDIRGVGERIRRVSAFEANRESELHHAERARLRALVQQLLRDHREQELLQLRDVQAMLFAQSVAEQWQNPNTQAEMQIKELGANILPYLDDARAWFETYELRDATLIALFCMRWAELLGVEQHLLLSPSANAHRLIQRFLVLYQLERRNNRDEQQLLAVLAAVPKYSPEYPSEYARGIVLYQMGAFPDAAMAFERHLTRHPDGAWAARAHNFRLEAIRASTQ